MSILHVVFKVEGAEYAMPAVDVLQMESFTEATPVPGAAAHVVGIVQVRGKVVPVISLRARFGLPPAPPTLDTRLVVGQPATTTRPVALLVDSARQVLKLDPAEIEPPPRTVVEEARGFVRAVARVGARLIMLIDFEKVIGEEVHHG